MPIEVIHTYLVYPNKGVQDADPVVGNDVPQEGRMFTLLSDIYDKSEDECSIGIAFRRGEDGAQVNSCRTNLVDYVDDPTIDSGRTLAERLSSVTTNRSGLGLMFLIYGREGADHKVVLSRFRANNGVLVDEAPGQITVEFIDRIFMKNAHSYKAVVYQHTSLDAGFWEGFAVDKQINSRDVETSDYWVKEFLLSEFRTTPATGTRRLAIALRDASHKTADLEVKKQITAAVALAAGINDQLVNAEEFCERFGFSEATTEAVKSAFGRVELVGDNFSFDAAEFDRQLPYRTVEIDNGAMLTAQSAHFDDVFEREVIDEENDEVRYSTAGKIVSERLEKTK